MDGVALFQDTTYDGTGADSVEKMMNRAGFGEYGEVIDALTYSAELSGLTTRDIQTLGVSTEKSLKKVRRQIDALDSVARQLIECLATKD